jgi:hypothetical protein
MWNSLTQRAKCLQTFHSPIPRFEARLSQMRKPERSSYTPLDFLQWHEGGTLHISPKFQRRGVWSRAAQSYFIDTLLLGLPVPPLYLRVIQDTSKKAIVREVVDGQQRLTALLGFMNDDYALSKNIQSESVGKQFSELEPHQKDAITQYSFICEIFYGADDSDILQIFARLNTYSVKLNDQELRNGQYFGRFKQAAYSLALEHLEFWRKHRLFTEQAIARMQEVELTSELMIALLAGMQDKKKSMDSFYEKYDEKFVDRKRTVDHFRTVVDGLNDSLPDGLGHTEFRRVPLFYSLFCTVAHRLYGLPSERLPNAAAARLSKEDREGLHNAVAKLSEVVANAREERGRVPASREAFVTACLRQTDNIRPRRTRFETIYKTAFD